MPFTLKIIKYQKNDIKYLKLCIDTESKFINKYRFDIDINFNINYRYLFVEN